jgi:hypothetical protein
VQSAGGQDEFTIAVLLCEHDAGLVNVAECQFERKAAGAESFAGGEARLGYSPT